MTRPSRTEKLSIPSSTDQLEKVDQWIESIASEMGFDDSALADLGICVTEAAMNAIVHAHREQPELKVDLQIDCFPDCIRIAIRDHGNGFDETVIPDPTEPENLLNVGGRGILLMRAIMDEVRVDHLPDGTKISLVKKLAQS